MGATIGDLTPPLLTRPERESPRPWLTAAVLAAAAAMLSFCASTALAGRAPFGPASRNVNDLGNQFIAFHAGLWDVLHGSDRVTWTFNWHSALGVPFLPDYATYLGGPFPLLVGLFPRDAIELAVHTITTLRLGVAAAVAVACLRTLRPTGSPWWAAFLAFTYATCGWALDDAAYVPMWLDGLIALPALTIVGEWARRRRHLLAGVLVVACCWWANYYTAYMASLGAALLLLARVTAHDHPRDARAALLRFAGRGALGVTLTAVTLLPTLAAVAASQDAPGSPLSVAPWSFFAARALPWSEGVGLSPGLAVGTTALLLALTLPWHRAVPTRTRLTYCGGFVLLLLSLQTYPTQLLWNAGDTPNGSPYRQAFVVAFWLVVAAWHCVADRLPTPPALTGGLTLVALLVVLAHSTPDARTLLGPHALPATVLLALLTAAALAAPRLHPRATAARPLAAAALAVLAVTAVAENVVAGVVVDTRRAARLGVQPRWDTTAAPVRAAVGAHLRSDDGWPLHRLAGTDGHDGVPGANPGLLAGYPGPSVYSSIVPAPTSAALTDLGLPMSGYGRLVTHPTADPGLDPLLAIGGLLRPAGPDDPRPVVTPTPARPLVTVLPPRTGPDGATPFTRRNALGSRDTVTIPALTARFGDGPTRPHQASTPTPGRNLVLEGRCPAGTTIQVDAPFFDGAVGHDGGRHILRPSGGVHGRGRNGVLTLATVPADGAVRVAFASTIRSPLPDHPIGCLDRAALAADVDDARAQQPTIDVSGSHVTATWPVPVRGQAVVATTDQPGWSCTVDGRPADTHARAGLLAVDVHDARTLTCRHHTPRLTEGAVLTLAGAALLAGLHVVTRRRRRTRP